MRWIVGVDLLELSHGAIRFAAWIHRHQPAEELIGVHCLGPHETGPEQSEEDFHAWIQGLAERSIGEIGALGAFRAVKVVDAETPEEGLEQALRREEADVLVIGRKAKRMTDPIVRLGRAARRLLRTVALPVAVVPPDIQTLPPGPVVLATDLRDSSRSALSFARAFADKVGRPLRVVYAVALEGSMQAYLTEKGWDRAQQEAVGKGQAALAAYLAKHDVVAQGEVVCGSVTFELLAVCEREAACAMICGSRRLSFVEQLFSSSVGSELASLSPIPVIVVPPAATA